MFVSISKSYSLALTEGEMKIIKRCLRIRSEQLREVANMEDMLDPERLRMVEIDELLRNIDDAEAVK